jgi:hypothetical protein
MSSPSEGPDAAGWADETPHAPPPALTSWRVVVTTFVVVVMAGCGYVAEFVAAVGTRPTCRATSPPGPPSFLVASAVITLLCGLVPALVVGIRHWRAALLVFALGAVVPLGLAVFVATRTTNGFCF